MIQYYETLARSSESIRRGKVANETAFLSMHETSMDAFFHLFRKKESIYCLELPQNYYYSMQLNFDRIVIFLHMKKSE